jgi:pimeloyl-ACP methyl ester carboxylesterase
MPSARIILFTGMGADARLLEPQRAALPDVQVIEWLPHRDGETLRAYAARMAAAAKIESDDIIGGASMGGMVALEAAVLTRPRGVILIGSCRSPDALTQQAHNAVRLGRFTPTMMLDKLRRLSPWAIKQLGVPRDEDRATLLAMANASSMSFLKWAGNAIAAWPGCPDPGVPVRHIHGTRDRILSHRRAGADASIAGAGHVPSLTHAAEVNAFITRVRAAWSGD